MTKIIDGRQLAETWQEKIKEEIKNQKLKLKLVVFLIGDDPASHLYVNLKRKACEKASIDFQLLSYSADFSEDKIIKKIEELNQIKEVTGILVQLPLPTQNTNKIIASIDPKKDVDGFHLKNLEKLKEGKTGLISATALGIIKLIKQTKEPLEGKEAVIISSQYFADPIIELLKKLKVSSQVINANSPFLKQKTLIADILIVAVGQPNLITGDMIKKEVIILDVGTNKVKQKTIIRWPSNNRL